VLVTVAAVRRHRRRTVRPVRAPASGLPDDPSWPDDHQAPV